MSAVFDHYPHGGALKLTFLCLADHANDTGDNCYPSIAAIARRTCCSESQARRNVHVLIDSGYISVEPGTEQGGGSSRRYCIKIERLTPSTDATPCMDATPSTDASPPLAPMRVTPSTHDTRTIINHQEPSMRKRSALRTGSNAVRFEQWYAVYPKKKSRGDAEKAWKALSPDDDLVERMIRAVENQKAEHARCAAAGTFTPSWKYPATWLRAKAWDDEQETTVRQPLRVAI